MKNVVVLFDDIADAQAAINDLVAAGFDRADISLIASDRWTTDRDAVTGHDVVDADQLGDDVAAGLTAGGVIGGLGGVLLGLGALAIPGIGPIIAAGPLVAGLTGAGIGAAVGGLVGALVNWGVPPEDADVYAESVRRGDILVALKTDDSHVERAVGIMNNYAPIDVERRSEEWRAAGWTAYEETSDYEQHVDYGDTTGWTPKQMVADTSGGDYLDYSTYTPAFRNHYEANYGGGREYAWYDPAYRYGYSLAHDDRYRDYETWDEIEADAMRGWADTDNAVEREWNEFKAAVREGWEQVRDALFMSPDREEYDPIFRSHFDETYRGGTRDYNWYVPAYDYGYRAGLDTRYDQYTAWDDRLESDIRRQWEAGEYAADSTWEEVKDAIRQGWVSVRNAFNGDTENEPYVSGTYRDR